MSDQQRFVRYGDRTMEIEQGMTLEQVKDLMARHFPELADPKIETQKDAKADTVTYVFSKKAGHKGSSTTAAKTRRVGARHTNTAAIRKLTNAPKTVVVDARVVKHFETREGDAMIAANIASNLFAEVDCVRDVRAALVELTSAIKPAGSVL